MQLIRSRSRWWWSCDSSGVEYIDVNQICHAGCQYVFQQPLRVLFDGLTRAVCFMGGPIVNKLGVKWALVIGSMSFPIEGSAYYCNSKFGNQWVSESTPRLPKHNTWQAVCYYSTSFSAVLLAVLEPVAGMLLRREPSWHLRRRGPVESIWLCGLWRGILDSWLGVLLSESQQHPYCMSGFKLIVWKKVYQRTTRKAPTVELVRILTLTLW